ncbi:uncharacterized protein LOC120913518 isoform X2 [Rana temporaria]|uniref:uncharacterized protein LOC120913518 isoform X2 n=1 Tax=Rana temporaria TaxID=8407 RepID=UPI001AADE785|nr:uncharacterized protein LOC120913518 isoform X2 [Rana temporaria]
MDYGLKTLLLLALCTLAKTEENNVLEEEQGALAVEKTTIAADLSPEYRTITLNVTICIPKYANNDTKIIRTSQDIISGNTFRSIVGAAKPGPKTPCNITSCMLDKVPELAVYVFKEDPEKQLICSTNVTNENLFVTINASTSEISITPKKESGTLNSALVSVDVVAERIEGLSFSSGDSDMSFVIKVKQLWIPTTKTVPTTIHFTSPTTKKVVVETTSNVTSKQTTNPKVRNSTITQETSQKPVVTSSKAKPTNEKPSVAPVVSKASSLGHEALWGMMLLVLKQIFLN